MNTTTAVKKVATRIQGPEGLLYVDDGGTGDIPVLFVHSFGGNTGNWKNQLQHLRENRRAIAFDFRSHGKSDAAPAGNFSASDLGEDIAAVADSLHLNRFILVAHSMGGAAAIAYTDKHPERVAGLFLAGTPGRIPAEQAKPIISSLESASYQKVMDDYMKQLLANAKPEVDSMINNDFKKIPKDVSISIIKSMFEYNPLPPLKHYQGPLFLVYTTRESEQPHSLPNQLSQSPAAMIDGTSHWTQLDKPEEFNKLLDDFLKTVEREEE